MNSKTPIFKAFELTRKYIVFFLIFCFNPVCMFGQGTEICGNGFDDNNNGQIDEDCYTCSNGQDNIWYFGFGAGLDFNNGTGVLIPNGMTNIREGCTTVSNSNGELLFYSDGRTIRDRTHQVMAGTNAIMGGGTGSSTHAVIAIPNPSNPLQYHIVTADQAGGISGATYEGIVDFSPPNNNSGLGRVNLSSIPLIGQRNSTEKLAIAKHSNCRDFWLITHDFLDVSSMSTGNNYFVYLIDRFGFNITPTISTPANGTVHGPPNVDPFATDIVGQLVVSPQNDRIANTITGKSTIDVSVFNPDNGVVGATINLVIPSIGITASPYGVAFSPSGRYLYVSTVAGNIGDLYRFDLQATNIQGSLQLVAPLSTLAGAHGQLKLTPDGSLCLSRIGQLAFITNPDASNITALNITFINDPRIAFGLPNTISDFCTPQVTATASPNQVCVGEIITVSATATNGAGQVHANTPPSSNSNFAFNWNTGANTDNFTTVAPANISPNYSVTATDHYRCTTTASTGISVAPGVTINKTMSPGPYTIGTNLVFYIEVCNPNGIALNNIRVTDVLPNGLSFVSSPDFTLSNNTRVPNFNLAPNTCATFRIVARPTVGNDCKAAKITNTAVAKIKGCPEISSSITFSVTETANSFTTISNMSINQALTLGLLYPSGTPQNVILSGVIGVDVDYTFDNSLIRMDEGAEIIVTANNALTLENTHIHGCDHMWKRILVQPNAELYIRNCTIEDGEYAITMQGGVGYEFKNNTFKNNFVSITNTNAANILTNPYVMPIIGNTFMGTGSFLPRYTGQPTTPNEWPFAGIEINYADILDIRQLQASPVINTFQDMANGIVARGTPVRVDNALFLNMKFVPFNAISYPNTPSGFSLSNIGIYVAGGDAGNIASLNQKGFGNLQSSTPSFNNCALGIYLTSHSPVSFPTDPNSGVDFNIELNNMQNVGIAGVLAVGNTGRIGVVRNNRIVGLSTGIWMFHNDPMYSLEIKNNFVRLDGGSPISGGIRFDEHGGLEYTINTPFDPSIPVDLGTMTTSSPLIEQNTVELRNAREGIRMNGTFRFKMTENTVQFLRNSGFQQYPNRTGIFTMGTFYSIVDCNTVKGDPNALLSQYDLNGFLGLNNNNSNNIGLRVDFSDNRYSCNQFDLLPTAVQVNDISGSFIRGNRFDRVSRGLWYRNGSITGIQPHRGNRWISPPTPIFQTNFSATAPFTVVGAINECNFPFDVSSSRYTYDQNANPQFEPFSVQLPNLPSFSTNFWFNQQNQPSTGTFNCNINNTCNNPIPTITPPTLASLDPFDQLVIAGNYQPNLFPATQLFQANYIVYSKIKQFPYLAPPSSASAIFENQMDQQSEGDFYQIEQYIKDLYDIPVAQQNQLAAFQQQIEDGINDLYRLDSLWVVDTTHRDSIRQISIATGTQLETIKQQYEQLNTTIYQARIAFADALAAMNNSIPANQDVERNIKRVNKIYLENFAKGIYKLSNGEITHLDRIARQCPLEGGKAVYQARSMVSFFTRMDYETLEDCTPDNNQAKSATLAVEAEVKSSIAKIYPNPAENQCTLAWQLSENIENGQILIFNALGQLLDKINVKGNVGQEVINLSNYPGGVYVCKLYFEGKEVYQEKLIIAK